MSRTAGRRSQRAAVLAEALPVSARDVRIEVAALGSQRLLVGAAELAWDALIADPLAVVGAPRDGKSFATVAP